MRVLLIALALLAPTVQAAPDQEYIEARNASWEGYASTKKQDQEVKEYSGVAFNICRLISEKTREPYQLEEDKLFCKLAKQHKDWVWFELPDGGSMYCGSSYAVSMNGVNPIVILNTIDCNEEFSVEVVQDDENIWVNDTAMFQVDGKLFKREYKNFENEDLVDALANTKDNAKLYYAQKDDIKTVEISTSGSSAALRFLGLIRRESSN